MSAPAAARALRESVDRAGGRLRISEAALSDTFGRGRLTARSRTGIARALESAGLTSDPAITQPAPDGWVTLRAAAAAAAPAAPPASDAPDAAPGTPPAMVAGALVAGVLGTALGLAGSVTAGIALAVLAVLVVLAVRARGAALRRDLAPRLPRPVRGPAALGAVAYALPAVVVAAVALGSLSGAGGTDRGTTLPASTTPTATRTTPPPSPTEALLQRADQAERAGDFRTAVRLTQAADPARVPALRARIARTLVTQARVALQDGAYVRAIQLVKRARRAGPSPGSGAILRQARAGLDRRRAAQRAGRDANGR